MIAGIDTGSRRTAIAIGEPLPPGSPYRCRMLAPPDVLRMTAATDDEIAMVAAGMVLRCRNRGVTLARLEWVFKPYIPKTAGPKEAAARMRAGLETMRLSDRIAVGLESIGVEVVKVAASSWRARLFAFAKEIGVNLPPFKDRSPEFGFFLAHHVEGWPALSNEDMRDAAGILLAACLPPRPEAPRKALPHVDPEEDKRHRYHPAPPRLHTGLPPRLAETLAIVGEGGPWTAPRVAERLGCATPTAAVYLHRLAHEGALSQPERGRYVLAMVG